MTVLDQICEQVREFMTTMAEPPDSIMLCRDTLHQLKRESDPSLFGVDTMDAIPDTIFGLKLTMACWGSATDKGPILLVYKKGDTVWQVLELKHRLAELNRILRESALPMPMDDGTTISAEAISGTSAEDGLPVIVWLTRGESRARYRRLKP